MNLSGVPNYNSELMPLRNPSSKNSTTNGLINKLVFLFPMIFDDGLQKVKFNTVTQGDADNLVDLIRAFHCISVLKEILVSNAINIITLAAKYNDEVIDDKSSESKEYRQLIYGGSNNSYSYSDKRYGDNVSQYDLAKKLNEKIEFITRLIKTDPRYTKLLPFIEIITLNNMFDVPVVVGTSPNYVPSTALFSLLVGSIGLRKSLCVNSNNESASLTNVQTIINALKALKNQKDHDLYNDLKDEEKTPSTPEELLSQYYGGNRQGGSFKFPFINKFLNKFEKKTPVEVYMTSRNAVNNSSNNKYAQKSAARLMKKSEGIAAFEYIRELTQDDFLQLRIAFENSLSRTKLSEKYGLKDESGASHAFKEVSGEYYDLFTSAFDDFSSILMNQGTTYVDSIYAMLKPADPLQLDGVAKNKDNQFVSWAEVYSKDNVEERLKTDILSKLVNSVKDKLASELEALLQTSNFTDTLINNFGRMCESAKEEVISVLNTTTNILNKYALNDTHIDTEVNNFMDGIHKINNNVDAATVKFTRALSDLLGGSTDKILKPIHKIISDAIEVDLMMPLKKGLDNTIDQNGAYANPLISYIYVTMPQKGKYVDPLTGQVSYQPIPFTRAEANVVFIDCENSLRKYLTGIMTLILYVKTCEFINVYNVKLTTHQADVLDLPNFSLIIPLKYANFLYTLKSQKDWKSAILGTGTSETALNPFRTTDPKFVVREINNILNVPNLYVYDEAKKEVYYKLQWYKNVEKMKLAAMNIFVSEHLKKPEIFQPY